ncbi:MAG TPA: response regulator [Burkholderiales bacterium]|nr:response regulator [Burkholderiales bacterium]
MRLLLVEDDPLIGEGLRAGLKPAGFTVDWVKDGVAATLALTSAVYEAVVLDLGLPRKDGLTLLRELRSKGNTLPVLVLTARDTVPDRVLGLNTGADDYVVKPFELDELIARIRALLRRRAGRAEPVIRHGGLLLDPVTRRVEHYGALVAVSPREFALLHALLERPGAVLSREQLEERLYGWDEEVSSNAVEVHLHNLRRKLGPGVIRNVRGAGYCVADSGEIDP